MNMKKKILIVLLIILLKMKNNYLKIYIYCNIYASN